jgi:hypothetical protein
MFMATRRDVLKFGAAGAGYSLLAPKMSKADLVFPDGFIPSIVEAPSPPVRPFVVPLNVMPIAKSVSKNFLSTAAGGGMAPDPQRHQRYHEFEPKQFYVNYLEEFRGSITRIFLTIWDPGPGASASRACRKA